MRTIAKPGGNRRIDFMRLANHYLQALALSLAASVVVYVFTPGEPYPVPLVYSLCIGSSIWAIAEAGSCLLNSSTRPGWPPGIKGLALTLIAITGGYLLGTFAADAWFGWSSWQRGLLEQRSSWLVSLLAGGAGFYYFFSRSKQSQLHAQVEQALRLAAEARLKLLQTQLEPHMLFNTLANLRVLIGSDPARARHMLDHLIAYLRATLGASRATTHALQAEFERLADYLELMAVRMGPRLRYTLDLPAELANHPVPTLLLQPLVENSIRHGLEPKVDGGSIHVSACREGSSLLLEVADTGVGMQAGACALGSAHGGFGVAQVRERLHTVYHEHGTIYFVANSPAGTKAIIRFPFENSPTNQSRSESA
jgi:hypothetical protein